MKERNLNILRQRPRLDWVTALPQLPELRPSERWALEFFLRNPGAKIKDYARAAGKSYSEAQRVVYSLLEKNLLVRIDRGRYVANCKILLGGGLELRC